ncbi:RNA polymerase sigma factor [Telluribacter sp.]|jgi:RNA polymerase sigma-70 factor (ECF subfamily)|uniref:RNA polymerase sigma factor n=1 Tax=Telluribacter sp. TaxID=1978767 RepID=UPI002E101B2A|nr:sigma-70 family RNA polymerase sigma factor [Telluribacter sp.]
MTDNMPGYNSAVLLELLDGCLLKDRRSQELLYRQFYGYAMGICLRYTRSRDEAKEILNDGFLKIFTKLESFDSERSFKAWMSRIMINTALDHFRREQRQHPLGQSPLRQHQGHEGVEAAENVSVDETATSQLSHEELIGMIQQLPPSYRVTFCMAVIDGYTHEEIAEQLGITVGGSKSNLSRARQKLKVMLAQKNADDYERVTR